MNTIYKLYCKDENIKDFYIGSSKKFKTRKYAHKSNCNNENGNSYNFKLYKFIRANGGFQNFDFEILLETDDNIKKNEQKYIDELKPTLNCNSVCGLDKIKKKEYEKKEYQKNKIKRKEKQRLYYERNKDKIREKNRLYYHKKKYTVEQIDNILEPKYKDI
tara:strand:+ start:138 stop:620 length:483 start_codon:yes stop_codon:yes gene_type:complete